MKVLLLQFAISVSVITSAQQVNTIPVALTNVEGNHPFYNLRTRTKLSDSSGFKGIPVGLKEFRIKELAFRLIADKLFILYGRTSKGNRVIIFDADFDKDFSNEKTYLFDNDLSYNKAKETAVVDSTRSVQVKVSAAPGIFIKPNLFNCCAKYNFSTDSIWHLFVETFYHREGTFLNQGKSYKLAAAPSISPFYEAERTNFFLSPATQDFKKESDENQTYRPRSPIIIEGQEFSVDSINRFGDTAWIAYKGYKDSVQGNRQGLYAQNIEATSIDNNHFNLSKLKGKYVLLDFWGTWCNPCIALIPRIKKLNDRYKSKGLVLVSIAFDKNEDYSKLLKLIADKKMDWINIFDNQNSAASITQQYDVNCFPTSILINPEGKIVMRSCGSDDFKILEEKLSIKLKQ